MNFSYLGSVGSHSTISISLHIGNNIDVTSESKDNSLGPDPISVPSSDVLKTEADYTKTPWSNKHINVLVAAKMKYSQEMRGKKLWERVAHEVQTVRPSATAQTCKKKYNRHVQGDPGENIKKLDEEIETSNLGELINPRIFDNESRLKDPTEKIINVQQNLKRKIDEISNEEGSEDTSKRQKISSKWIRWEESESAKLSEIVNRTAEKGKEFWLKVSEEMGNKTPKQCRYKWKNLNKPKPEYNDKKQYRWSETQINVLREAKPKGERPNWTEIAKQVSSVRPGVTPTECRKKYQYMNLTGRV